MSFLTITNVKIAGMGACVSFFGGGKSYIAYI